MMFFAKSIEAVWPGAKWLSFPGEVEQFGLMMHSQLDLKHEAKNLTMFQSNFKDRRLGVVFPTPIHELSMSSILVEEFENAVPLKWFLKMGGMGFEREIATAGLDAFLVSDLSLRLISRPLTHDLGNASTR